MKSLFEIFRLLDYPFAENCYHLAYGMVYLPEGKMKSREGNVVDAASVVCPPTGCPNPIALGDDVTMKVIAKDNIGFPITGVNIIFTWTAPAGLGYFTKVDGVTQTGQPTTVISTPTIKDGTSTAILKIPFSSTGGTVTATVAYAEGTATTNFVINVWCNSDPILYYGIGGVRDNGDDNWQYSTAEILETCKTEYKLYEGTGERY